jgi:hypothetical protein
MLDEVIWLFLIQRVGGVLMMLQFASYKTLKYFWVIYRCRSLLGSFYGVSDNGIIGRVWSICVIILTAGN